MILFITILIILFQLMNSIILGSLEKKLNKCIELIEASHYD